MQKIIPIDELRPSWKSHLEFYAFSSRPPIRQRHLGKGPKCRGLPDHLISLERERRGKAQAEGLGRLEVEHQLEQGYSGGILRVTC